MHRISRLLSKNLPPDDLATALWPVAVGKRLAARTGPVRLRGTTLLVDVDDSTWASSLQTLSPQILENLRRVAPSLRINALELRLVPQRRPPALAFDSTSSADPADGIADPIFRHLYLASRAEAEREEALKLGASA
jgi:hypothetical protein